MAASMVDAARAAPSPSIPADTGAMRRRYFKQAKQVKVELVWEGEPVSPPPVAPRERRLGPPQHLHYQAFTLGSLRVEVGDHVLVKSVDTVRGLEECDVVRVERLYRDYSNPADPHRAVVSWLCRPDFLPPALKGSGHGLEEQGAPPLDAAHEVVGEARDYDTDISAESIYYRCQVVQGAMDQFPEKVANREKREAKVPCYLHRFDMKMVRKTGKKCYRLEPLVAAKARTPSGRRVLAETPTKPAAGSSRLGSRASSRASGSPEELSSFVTGTVEGVGGLNGGYWEVELGKRTPGGVKERLVETEKSTNSGRKIKIKFGTQMETATGSGRKVTLRCGKGASGAPSPTKGLAPTQISSLLDSDPEDEAPATQPRRKRRASVSCTTPGKERAPPPRKRPASEVKKGRRSVPARSVEESDDSDDDFMPVMKVGKGSTVVTKVGRARRVASQSEDSSPEPSSEEEEEPVVKKRKSMSKTVNAEKTEKKTYKKRVFQPRVAPRSKPLADPGDALTEAQRRLHVSAVPDALPCREEEFAEVYSYVEGKLREGGGGCYYISGVPGTGKTATVMEVVRSLQEAAEDYPEFHFYSINGMRLTSPEQAYVEMWRLLTGERATPEHAMKLLAARFTKAAPKRATSIFLVDELDMLCNRKQSVLYNIFDWPSRPEGKLIVIAIANTMDLPERVMVGRVSSRLGLTRQTFQPYTHTQLQTIVASRLEGLQVFQQDAVQLVARKVASLSGDARRALDICRRAAEMAESGGKERIGLGHVTAAYQEMFTSPKIQAIRSCSKYEQVVLQVVANEFHRTGVEETSLGPVFRELCARLRTEGLPVLSLPGAVAACARLSAMRLLLAEHYRHGLETKLRLNVAADDISFALKEEKDDD